MRHIPIVAGLLAALAFAGCDRGWPDVYWRSGAYKLIAIDTRSQMSLAHDSVTSSIVPATIFAIGANNEFIVIKQHPYANFAFNRSLTNYFVVRRSDGQNIR